MLNLKKNHFGCCLCPYVYDSCVGEKDVQQKHGSDTSAVKSQDGPHCT